MLKKETRILGLSAPTRKAYLIPFVGAVYRGSLWLDGIITCIISHEASDPITPLSSAIIGSRHYTQLRAVILSDRKIGKLELDTEELARRIRIPVIVLHPFKSANPLKEYRFQFRGRPVTVQASLAELDVIRGVFQIGCANDSLVPEAVRVAQLIAKNLSTSVKLQEIK